MNFKSPQGTFACKRGNVEKETELDGERIEAVEKGVRSGDPSPCDSEHVWLSLKIPLFWGSQT